MLLNPQEDQVFKWTEQSKIPVAAKFYSMPREVGSNYCICFFSNRKLNPPDRSNNNNVEV